MNCQHSLNSGVHECLLPSWRKQNAPRYNTLQSQSLPLKTGSPANICCHPWLPSLLQFSSFYFSKFQEHFSVCFPHHCFSTYQYGSYFSLPPICILILLLHVQFTYFSIFTALFFTSACLSHMLAYFSSIQAISSCIRKAEEVFKFPIVLLINNFCNCCSFKSP